MPHAEYLLLEVRGATLDVRFRQVPFDLAALRRDIVESGMPHAERWAAGWR
ncbi:hypothetical protein HNR42_001833 [Deinobacterium chartae]|uniref:Uncharacterized protein n=1 Tax=Deinobacterium chartae TaxID=521158 RepID=A0A841I1Y7_9DEIO|nr:hypothetical protein [Deinobacterium chartae]MBB6098399.1 hypothetical protein [Deinobacterium chartae]